MGFTKNEEIEKQDKERTQHTCSLCADPLDKDEKASDRDVCFNCYSDGQD